MESNQDDIEQIKSEIPDENAADESALFRLFDCFCVSDNPIDQALENPGHGRQLIGSEGFHDLEKESLQNSIMRQKYRYSGKYSKSAVNLVETYSPNGVSDLFKKDDGVTNASLGDSKSTCHVEIQFHDFRSRIEKSNLNEEFSQCIIAYVSEKFDSYTRMKQLKDESLIMLNAIEQERIECYRQMMRAVSSLTDLSKLSGSEQKLRLEVFSNTGQSLHKWEDKFAQTQTSYMDAVENLCIKKFSIMSAITKISIKLNEMEQLNTKQKSTENINDASKSEK